MEKEEYKVMYEIEDYYWWYVGLRKLVFSSIDKFACKGGILNILDAGCGTGKILESCKAHAAYGLDFSDEAIKFCKIRGLNNIVKGSISEIPFPNNSFDVVISLDVIYHLNVEDDLKALKEFHRVAKKGGILILNIPAYNFLRSKHDIAVHTKHRYTYSELKKKIKRSGFIIEAMTYRINILFLFAFIKRIIEKLLFKKTEKTGSDLKPLPALLNNTLAMLLFLENILILSGIKLPFGLSLYCIARKNEK